MALIGTGTKTIPNVVGTGVWRSQDVDQGLAAFAEQLGGVGWTSGVPTVYPGNLDSTNFASGMLLGSDYLAQPNAKVAFTTSVSYVSSVADSSTPAKQRFVCSQEASLSFAGICIGNFSGATDLTGSVDVKVNDAVILTFTPGDDSSDVYSATTSSILSKASLLSTLLSPGDVIEVDSSALSESTVIDYSVCVTLAGTGRLVE